MTIATDPNHSFESLTSAVSTLSLKDKQKLADILEQQIFEAEEDAYEEDEQTIAEIESARAAYKAGEYDTYEDYVANRTTKSS